MLGPGFSFSWAEIDCINNFNPNIPPPSTEESKKMAKYSSTLKGKIYFFAE